MLDVLLCVAFEMIADFVVQAAETVASAHAGLNTRAIARASVFHLLVSTVSCRRPMGVSR
jgi:hypothetical protein